jgi:hypothetical protein
MAEKETEAELAQRHLGRWDKLKSDTTEWESHWQDIVDKVLPRKGNIISIKSRGAKRMQEVFDCTAIMALDRFASGLYDYLCPPNKRWFMLRAKDNALNDVEEYKTWLSETTQIAHEEIAISNFNLEIYEHFTDLGSVGTGCLFVDKGVKTSLLFSNRNIGEYRIAENSKGLVDTVYRRIKWTARQAVQEFGIENLSDEIRGAYNDDSGKNKDKEFEFLHVVEPNGEADDTKLDNRNMEFTSLWFEVKSKKIVLRGGFRKMRYLVDRFMKGSGEIYGRSPSTMLLPTIKLVNKATEQWIVHAEKINNPPILAPHDGFVGTVRTTPGSILYWKAVLGQHAKPEPLNVGGDPRITLEMIQQLQDTIKDGFYNDLFLILSDDKKRTATEVLEIAQEKLNLLGPNFGRSKVELFDPCIEISIDLLYQQGKIRAAPAGLDVYDIEYISKLALAMKFAEVRAVGNTMAYLGPLGEIDPSIWDNYSLDEISRGIGEMMGVPVDWLRPTDERDEMRRARQERQEMMQAAQVAAAAADAVPKLSKKVEEGSPLEAIAGAA